MFGKIGELEWEFLIFDSFFLVDFKVVLRDVIWVCKIIMVN